MDSVLIACRVKIQIRLVSVAFVSAIMGSGILTVNVWKVTAFCTLIVGHCHLKVIFVLG